MPSISRLPPSVTRLLNTPLLVRGNLSKVCVRVGHRGPGHAGPRCFVKEYFPPIKFHNEHVEIRREIIDDPNAKSELVIQTSTDKEQLDIHGLRSDDILSLLISKGVVQRGESCNEP